MRALDTRSTEQLQLAGCFVPQTLNRGLSIPRTHYVPVTYDFGLARCKKPNAAFECSDVAKPKA